LLANLIIHLPADRQVGTRNVHMLTHEEIVKAVAKAATQFSLEKVSYFGSYADGNATEKSDLDVLVEFSDPPV